MAQAHILIVDDEQSVREVIGILVERMGHQAHFAGSGREVEGLLHQGNRYDMVITDLAMDHGDGMEVLAAVTQRDPLCPVVVITAYGTTHTAVEAMKKGAFDYVNKPFNMEEFRLIIDAALEHRDQARAQAPQRGGGADAPASLVGTSVAMRHIRHLVAQVADAAFAVLLTGESGTGKEVVARSIHEAGNRRNRPFVAVNCGALPEHLMESELFGHVKGAFTGADADKKGLFQAADGGTLFLDEVGELAPNLQVKLLRVLQEKTVRPVGAAAETPVDVRIISATNRDLSDALQTGRFRTDLYYRLNVISIDIPPLRERREDIAPLVDHLLPEIAASAGKPHLEVAPEALDILRAYEYPGNVRELRNILERAAAFAAGTRIGPEDLPGLLRAEAAPPPSDITIPDTGMDLDAHLAHIERQYIAAALAKTGGVQSAAAKLLGITVRSLRYRLNRTQESESDSK